MSTIVYDVLNRKLQSMDARGGTVTLAYDPNNNLLNLTDPVGNQTQWVYDALNRKVQETDPLFNIGTFAFDGADRMTSSTDKIGQRIAYAYDLLNRETGETWYNASGTAVNNLTFTFDANSNLLTQSWPVAGVSKTASMTWDSLDRLSTQSDAFATVLTNSYDAASNLLVFQDSFGGLTTRLYDVLNRVATMSYTGQSIALREDFHYTARDQVAGQIRYGNLAGTSTVGYSTFSYDGVGRVINLRHSNGSGANIANYTNTYDLASRITSEVLNAGLPTTYQYDSTDQLINDSVVSYSYDLNGNRTMTGYATGPANELTSDGTWNYAYDKNGNLIQKTNISTGEVFAFGYDIRNRMVAATDTTTSSLQMQATYGYDALNQRIQKNVEMGGVATITEFAYDNGQIWVDMNSSNALQTRYLRTDRVLELLSQVTSAGTATWMLADRMGSLRNVVNSTGVVINTITYDGYGNVTSESSPVNGGLYKYAGYRYDSETGLYLPDPSVRYYLPSPGQWTTVDPILIGGGDSNFRRYVRNNPANWTDPLGLLAINCASVPILSACGISKNTIKNKCGIDSVNLNNPNDKNILSPDIVSIGIFGVPPLNKDFPPIIPFWNLDPPALGPIPGTTPNGIGPTNPYFEGAFAEELRRQQERAGRKIPENELPPPNKIIIPRRMFDLEMRPDYGLRIPLMPADHPNSPLNLLGPWYLYEDMRLKMGTGIFLEGVPRNRHMAPSSEYPPRPKDGPEKD